jgi:hypothetical protein
MGMIEQARTPVHIEVLRESLAGMMIFKQKVDSTFVEPAKPFPRFNTLQDLINDPSLWEKLKRPDIEAWLGSSLATRHPATQSK